MGRYGNSPAFHPYSMEQRGGPSYHSSSYHAPHDGRSYESPSYYRGDRHRRTPSSRDYGSHRRRYRSRSRTPPRRRDQYTPNRYYDDRRHGGHRLPPEELNRGRFQATNNGDGEVGNSGNVPHDSAAVRGTASNDGGVGSIGTSQNLSNE